MTISKNVRSARRCRISSREADKRRGLKAAAIVRDTDKKVLKQEYKKGNITKEQFKNWSAEEDKSYIKKAQKIRSHGEVRAGRKV